MTSETGLVREIEFLHSVEDFSNDNIDAIIRLFDGTSWAVTFFTIANLQSLLARYKETGECLRGSYLWACDMVIVDNLERETLERVVSDLVEKGEHLTALTRIN